MKVLALTSSLSFLDLLAEMAWHYSSQVARTREGVFLEIEKSNKLFAPFEIIEGLQEKCHELQIPLQWALGKSPAEAWAFLVYRTRERSQLPLEALRIYLDPFQKEDTAKSFYDMLRVFQHLGFTDFSDFEKIPRSGLASRFGAQGLWALQRVEEDDKIPWPLWKPAEVITEAQIFDPDQRVQNSETLIFILKPLLERLMARLLWRHEALTHLRLTLHLEDFSIVKDTQRTWNFPFSFPQTQTPPILNILKEKLEIDLQKNPLESSVIFVEVQVLEKAPLPNRQKDFFSKKEEDLETEASLISRLHQKIGKEGVFKSSLRPTYRPEKAWRRDEKIFSVEYAYPTVLPPRPLVLFKQPKLLRKIGPYLIYGKKRHRVLDWQGPEKIASEWWTQSFQRQYWIVDVEGPTPEGQFRWWVFTDLGKPATENLFLHGIFD